MRVAHLLVLALCIGAAFAAQININDDKVSSRVGAAITYPIGPVRRGIRVQKGLDLSWPINTPVTGMTLAFVDQTGSNVPTTEFLALQFYVLCGGNVIRAADKSNLNTPITLTATDALYCNSNVTAKVAAVYRGANPITLSASVSLLTTIGNLTPVNYVNYGFPAPFNTTGTNTTFVKSEAFTYMRVDSTPVWCIGSGAYGIISISLVTAAGAVVCSSVPNDLGNNTIQMSGSVATGELTQGTGYSIIVQFKNDRVYENIEASLMVYMAPLPKPATTGTNTGPHTTSTSATNTGPHTSTSATSATNTGPHTSTSNTGTSTNTNTGPHTSASGTNTGPHTSASGTNTGPHTSASGTATGPHTSATGTGTSQTSNSGTSSGNSGQTSSGNSGQTSTGNSGQTSSGSGDTTTGYTSGASSSDFMNNGKFGGGKANNNNNNNKHNNGGHGASSKHQKPMDKASKLEKQIMDFEF